MTDKEKPLSLTVDEMQTFVGITFLMSILKFLRQNMYWQQQTRIKLIADNMSRGKYEVVRSHLKVVDDNLPTPAKKKTG